MVISRVSGSEEQVERTGVGVGEGGEKDVLRVREEEVVGWG